MTERSATEPIRILMADDEPVYLESTADLLRLKGFLVDTAQDAFQAAAFLKENTYDFLISDLVMPGNQDLDLLKVAAESCPDLNMIVITGYPSVATAREAIQLPVVAYLVKPVEQEDLIAAVREAQDCTRNLVLILCGKIAHGPQSLFH